jgi:hypothetical protein
MNLIDVFALLSIIAVTLFTFACQRSNRREAAHAERMRRCLESAIRAEGTFFPVGSNPGDTQ